MTSRRSEKGRKHGYPGGGPQTSPPREHPCLVAAVRTTKRHTLRAWCRREMVLGDAKVE